FCVGGRNLVNAAVRTVPIRIWIGVGRSLVVKVADIDGPVRANAQIGGTAPRVVRIGQDTAVLRADGAAFWLNCPPGNRVAEKVARDEGAAEFVGQGVGQIDGAAGRRAAGNLVAFQFGEVVIGVQVVERPVFAEAFVEV